VSTVRSGATSRRSNTPGAAQRRPTQISTRKSTCPRSDAVRQMEAGRYGLGYSSWTCDPGAWRAASKPRDDCRPTVPRAVAGRASPQRQRNAGVPDPAGTAMLDRKRCQRKTARKCLFREVRASPSAATRLLSSSAARLSRGDPWLCGPTSRTGCLYREGLLLNADWQA
jgi:hypothetical protein